MLSSVRNTLKLFTRSPKKNQALCSKIQFSNSESVASAVEPEKNYEEVRIPVPWGHIAGKWWGPQDKRPIFTIHGWQDNCGSFDRLIPLLPKDLGFLCVDFPGHGLSSQLPNGIFYHGIDAAIFMRRIQDYFKWERMSLLGHSMGSIMSFMYSSLFPELVDFTIGIDILKPFSRQPELSIEYSIKNIERFLKYDQLNQSQTLPPTYTYEELIEKQHNGSHESVAKENCKYILNRNIEKVGDKYFFTRDQRLKMGMIQFMHQKELIEYAKRISCPYLFIKANGGPFYEGKKIFYEIIDAMKGSNKAFELAFVEGSHHVHLNNPENVAEVVIPFLNKYAYGDRPGGIIDDIRIKIQDYFGWKKMSLMGHSMGAIMCFMYSCLFPKEVDLIACIDALKPFSILPGKLIEENVNNIDKFIYYDKLNAQNSKPPTYTYEECIQKQHLSFFKSIDPENCKYILNRSLEKSDGDKYFFTRDSRLKVGIIIRMQHDDILEHAKRVTCPLICLKATKSSYYEEKKYIYETIDVLKANNKDFEFLYVDGKHHIHLNQPEVVAGHFNEFFKKYAYGEHEHTFKSEIIYKGV